MMDIYYDFTIFYPKEYKPYGLDKINDKPWSFFSNILDQLSIRGGDFRYKFSEANFYTENQRDGYEYKDFDVFFISSDPKYGYSIEWFSRECIDSPHETFTYKGLIKNNQKKDNSTVFFEEIEIIRAREYLFDDIDVAKVFFKSIYDSRELPENRFEIFKSEF